MPLPIEDYALIGDNHTAALVGRDGSIDWLCAPRFDSPACFAALLGDRNNGRWLLAPAAPKKPATRRYVDDTLILETTFEADGGVVRVLDFMPPRDQRCDVIRIVEGVRGRVDMRMELVIRFDYGRTVPWVRRLGEHSHRAIAGADALSLFTPVPVRGEDMRSVAEFSVAAGERVPFNLIYHQSAVDSPDPIDAESALDSTRRFWRDWVGHSTYNEEHRDAVTRSLITLKALTYEPTGGIVAAPTTSLPEKLGGVRNWDYRYCWLRDATFTLYALNIGGYRDEALAWRDWLLRAAAGDPADLQTLYGAAGERRLMEYEADWLSGYEGAAPVRIGNAASKQFQLDVYGEVVDALHLARRYRVRDDPEAWELQRVLLDFLESAWSQPDEGIWEVRGPRRDFTHSKVLAWVAFDRAIKDVRACGFDGPVDRWTTIRDDIRKEVLQRGFNEDRNAFVQYFGADRLDASLLLIPLVGFLPPDDPRVVGTVEAVEQHLMNDGFVMRYEHDNTANDPNEVDGLPPGEGAFLPCSFWLADCYAVMNRHADAHALYDRLLDLRNDVGLLSEEYDPQAKRLVGNFPQAFTHVGLVNTAFNLSKTEGPAAHRPGPP